MGVQTQTKASAEPKFVPESIGAALKFRGNTPEQTPLQAKTSQGADADAARVRALAAYKDFLTLWKDADPDIPILIAAKAESNFR
jgi:hypothetical protein